MIRYVGKSPRGHGLCISRYSNSLNKAAAICVSRENPVLVAHPQCSGTTSAWRSCSAISRGWNAQLEVWRLISSEGVGSFAPVQVCDQAISNRIERADTWMDWCFERVSAWLRTRLEPWEDRDLVPWATEILAVDASTLDRLGRYLPWLRMLTVGTPDLLAGQMSALFNIRRQQGERVEWWPNARDHCKAHFLTLVEPVKAG